MKPLLSVVSILAVVSMAPAGASSPPITGSTIIGRVCLDESGSGRCDPDSPPGVGIVVTIPGGREVITDEAGRFSFRGLPSRPVGVGPLGLPVARASQVALFADVGILGSRASPLSPVWVTLLPGATAVVEIAVAVRPHGDMAPIVSGAATGRIPAVELRDGGLIYHVPLRVPPGHEVYVDKEMLLEVEGDAAMIPVLVGEREGSALILDVGESGRTRLSRQVVLRVPRSRGGDLFSPRPIEVLAVMDLPAPSEMVAPGLIRVPATAAPGTRLVVGTSEPHVFGENEWALILATIPKSGELLVTVTPPGGLPEEVTLRVNADLRARNATLLAADLRGGLMSSGAFVEGRLEGQIRRRLLDGELLLGVQLGDDDLSRISRGGPIFSARYPGARLATIDDVVHGPLLGASAEETHRNAAEATLWASYVGRAGEVALGSGRTGLLGADVGTFDRPLLGPSVDLSTELGAMTFNVRGGAHLGASDLVEGPPPRFVRAELRGVGGSVYWLPDREIMRGSERVWIEQRHPRTGVVAARRTLLEGVDYALDFVSGRLQLASPVGFLASPLAGRLAAADLLWNTVIVVDYARAALPGEDYGGGHGAIRVAGSIADVEVGVRTAAGWAAPAPYSLAGVDLRAALFPWLRLSAELATSEGDPFGPGADFKTSADGGVLFATSGHDRDVDTLLAPSGSAGAVRLELGESDLGVGGWWQWVSDGYGDGALFLNGARSNVGAVGRARLLDIELSLSGERSEGFGASHLEEESFTSVSGRLKRRFGAFSLAGEALHRRGATALAPQTAPIEGEATAAGAEVIWHASDATDLSLGHLQALSYGGAHPAGRDPTFTSVGVTTRAALLGVVGLRAGVSPELEPVLVAGWRAHASPDGDGWYGDIAVDRSKALSREQQMSVHGVRREYGEGASSFVEQRLVEGIEGLRVGQAVGASLESGTWRASAAYERGEILDDGLLETRRDGLHGSLVVRRGSSNLAVFGEGSRLGAPEAVAPGDELQAGPPSPSVVRWSAGLSSSVEPTRRLSLSGRLVTGSHATERLTNALEDGASREASIGLLWRSPVGTRMWPTVLAHYGQRLHRPSEDAFFFPSRRLQLARLGLVFGGVPGPEISVSMLGARREIVDGDLARVTSLVGVLTARCGVPLGPVEPAMEVGVRSLHGAGLPSELEPTLRTELLAVLGAFRFGLGGVLAGFAGTGVEDPAHGADTSRIYLVLRGAVQ